MRYETGRSLLARSRREHLGERKCTTANEGQPSRYTSDAAPVRRLPTSRSHGRRSETVPVSATCGSMTSVARSPPWRHAQPQAWTVSARPIIHLSWGLPCEWHHRILRSMIREQRGMMEETRKRCSTCKYNWNRPTKRAPGSAGAKPWCNCPDPINGPKDQWCDAEDAGFPNGFYPCPRWEAAPEFIDE